MDAVDVLLPYFGDPGLLQTAVRSVQEQDYENWRLIIVDDAYPSKEPIAWAASLQDPRITYVRNQENLGANRNFQKALGMAESPIVVMMGADDVMLAGYLKSVTAAMAAHPIASVVQPGVQVIDENGRRTWTLTDAVKQLTQPGFRRTVNAISGETMACSLLHSGWHYFPSLAWRRDSIQMHGFNPEYDVVQDLALLLDIAAAGGSLLIVNDVVFQYRRHKASDSSVRAVDGRRFAEERRFFKNEARRFRALGWPHASWAAKLHWTSRLHALVVLLQNTRKVDRRTALMLARHAFT
ncbi:glycosyltransferase family 2 protein [Arthrobacter sp. Edens01]|uniref:glycosyltransferase family 2 protein n=1 Tax=Arthrobacter sp. Edens01 TaxID=1732020 RepID=UPI0006DBBCA4|nr:glycosyltransferase family 2 protein [Arthrobacter sp. Edens01]KPN22155.1 glycosyl transferase family 2 [Arthrobacter sp. Edens01]